MRQQGNMGYLGDPSPFSDGDAKWYPFVSIFFLLEIRVISQCIQCRDFPLLCIVLLPLDLMGSAWEPNRSHRVYFFFCFFFHFFLLFFFSLFLILFFLVFLFSLFYFLICFLSFFSSFSLFSFFVFLFSLFILFFLYPFLGGGRGDPNKIQVWKFY